MRKTVVVVLVCLLGIVIVPEISAQSGNGSLRGKIVDEQGAAMPGATVTATSPQALAPVVAVTDGTGEYRLANLPPGTYTLKVELAGVPKSAWKSKSLNPSLGSPNSSAVK